MSIDKKMLEASSGWRDAQGGAVAPEGVDFDGTSDYLSRSSDLAGNADGKTFTFSCWAYVTEQGATGDMNLYGTTSDRFRVLYYLNFDYYAVAVKNAAGTTIFQQNIRLTTKVPQHTWTHFVVSVDLENSLSSCYVNDVVCPYAPSIITNDTIDFTNVDHYVAQRYTGVKYKGRLAHIYLDYTYRDLSNSANRRLFITDDLKPAANQASLSPILYLPMTDADTAHINQGTGGDFTANGTFATSQRGPNQDNCVASTFDGAADYLSSTSITGLSDGKVATFSCSFKQAVRKNTTYLTMATAIGGSNKAFLVSTDTNGDLNLIGYNSSNYGSPILNIKVKNNYFPAGQINHFSCSFDLTNASNRVFFINGVEITPDIVTTYTDSNISFGSQTATIGRDGSQYLNGVLGEVYFDTTYTGLSTDNPFWDSTANRPKPVRQVLDETGNTPLIAMPIDGSNAGLNLGTGGDFTVNSGPFTGTRGGSEYWARSIDLDGSTEYLSRGSLSASDSKEITLCISYKPDAITSARYLVSSTASGSWRFVFSHTGDASWSIFAKNSSDTTILYASVNTTITIGDQYVILISADLTNSSNRAFYINGVSQTVSWYTYTNSNIDFSNMDSNVIGAAATDFSAKIDGCMGNLYLTNEYVDFTDESNRLKFVDAFGYPIELDQAIEDGDIPNPLVYMKFDDPDALGTNLGTGGDFTVNGTVTQGADVAP